MLSRFKSGSIGLAAVLLLFSAASATAQIYPAPPEPIDANATTDTGNDKYPQVATDGAGVWISVWHSDENLGGSGTDDDIFFSRSLDNGTNWSGPGLLNTNATTDTTSYDRYPQLATDGAGVWIAVWHSNFANVGVGFGTDVYFARSTDDGQSWSAPSMLNTVSSLNKDDWQPVITTDKAGNWIVVWTSTEDIVVDTGADGDILYSRSTDNGVNWSVTSPLNTNFATDFGNDETVQVGTDALGNWIAAWQSGADISGNGTEGDIYYSRSTNNGQTWGAPGVLNANGNTDTGPDYSPQVTADGMGNWVAVWYTELNLPGNGFEYDIMAARSTDGGQSWDTPSLVNTNGTTDMGADYTPQVTTDRMGNWITVWRSDNDLSNPFSTTDQDIFYAHSIDNGASWTAPGLFTSAELDGADENPQLAADGAGNWIAVWDSAGNVSGGVDRDILFTTFTLLQHAADGNGDGVISLSELLRLIQFFNLGALHCDIAGEDGFNPGTGDQTCTPHTSDYNPQNWVIELNELLRIIQLFNLFSYYYCPGLGEDDFCPGTP